MARGFYINGEVCYYGSMNKTPLIVGLVAVVLIGGYLAFRSSPSSEVLLSPTPEASVVTSPSPSPAAKASPTPASTVKIFTVIGKPFSFNLSEIKVKKGDTVKIVFNNTEGLHDWVVDEFNAHTPRIQAGQSATIQFVADKAGTFEYYCSVGDHRAKGMRGSLIVQ